MKYLSCHYLRNAVQFWTDEISICCQSNIMHGEYFSLAKNYHGEKIDWEALTQMRIKYLEDMKKGILPKYCEGCIYAQEDEWPEYKPIINNIVISHWTHCNCNCTYCTLDKTPKQEPYKIMPVLRDMKEKGLLDFSGYLLFGGGEPALLKELDEILKFFFDNNIADVQINSSGIKYSDAIAKYLHIPNVRLTISPDSADKKLYKKIKQVDKSDDVWKNIKKYVKAQKDNKYAVKTKYILIPRINSEKQQIKDWLIKSKRTGVNGVIMDVEADFFGKKGKESIEFLTECYNYFEDEAEKLGLKVFYYAIGEFIKPYMDRYKTQTVK